MISADTFIISILWDGLIQQKTCEQEIQLLQRFDK